MRRQKGGVCADIKPQMKNMWKIIVAALLAACLPSGCAVAAKYQAAEEWRAEASERTAFCWLLADFRYSLNRPTGAWLAPRGRNSHHLGVDMFAPVGRPVRAIADGVVHDISTSGWGGGNVAIMIKHRLADGRWFIALYGHIRNIYGLRKGSRVQSCGTVGLIGPYRCGSHVHFGVITPGKLPHAPYGTSKKPNRNNFINPVRFLQTGQPEEPGKDADPPPENSGAAAGVAPQCASENLAEGSPEEDELLESVLGPEEPPLRDTKATAKAPKKVERKKPRRHAAKADNNKKKRAAKKKAGKSKVRVLQASKGSAKRPGSAPALKKRAAKRQPAAAKAQKTKKKSRKPAAGKRAARRR